MVESHALSKGEYVIFIKSNHPSASERGFYNGRLSKVLSSSETYILLEGELEQCLPIPIEDIYNCVEILNPKDSHFITNNELESIMKEIMEFHANNYLDEINKTNILYEEEIRWITKNLNMHNL